MNNERGTSLRQFRERIAAPRSPRTAAPEQDDEGSKIIKDKLKSMWNNMKYGWTLKTKTNFSKDSPVWLLGRCYHFGQHHMVGADRVDEFKSDFLSKVWLTYRREFVNLHGSRLTSDCGWGCMLRSGQMMLAQALTNHFLGRGWRWSDNNDLNNRSLHDIRAENMHRNIIKWFGDSPSPHSPFSLHKLVALGTATGKKIGDWYGPASVAYLLRQAVEDAARFIGEFRKLRVYVAQDCAVYTQDILDECDGEDGWKSVIILVPVRLGVEKLNTIYGPCLMNLMTLDSCLGIIGGRPNHSLYFIGFQDDKLIHLDPHYCQEVVNVYQPGFPLESFHCRSPRKLSLLRMDPSCCLGFYCNTRTDFDQFVKQAKPNLVPPQQKSDYPIFVFCEGRSKDAISLPRYSIPDDSLTRSGDEDDFGTEDFELL
ncbi:cysteine protease ATG4D [Neocloeon triangulifer]|uniref:cysteine protease ATG4D n=1 Tax=Neocloeon triangulifer TaxID=2078957 RepID=UPI00286EE663|nr:cysteine protease ATG4D [Neocloeon triangulifer]